MRSSTNIDDVGATLTMLGTVLDPVRIQQRPTHRMTATVWNDVTSLMSDIYDSLPA